VISLGSMVTPRIERDAEALNYARFIISPLERGYGVTLGNALRRVLLSSLEGAAVTSVRISDVMHEFSPVPGVREDVLQIMLQLKQLRMKLHDVDTAYLYLEVRGEGVVTAADIVAPPEVEIVNPELYLFTVDDPNVAVELEMRVERGRGYSPATERSQQLPIGQLAVDAIFSPVRRVNFEVSAARVGQSTNYDRLTLEIWTDGTLRPQEALSQAAQILVAHFGYIAGIKEETLTAAPAPDGHPHRLTSEMMETPIEELDLSVRVFNSLKRAGIATVGDVLELLSKGEAAAKSIRNFGEKSLEELKQKMREKGYLADEETES